MRCAVRACLVLLASMLPVMLTIPATPGGPGHAAVEGDSAVCPPLTLAASVASADQSECCHFGGGICGCKGGRAQCCKGNLTTSCPCGARATPTDTPVLRGSGKDGPPLRIRRAAFTTKIGGPPLMRMASWKAGEPVWFWLELDCPDSCVTQLVTGSEPGLKVTLYWYFDPGSGPILRDDLRADQTVSPEPQPPQVAIPVILPAGNWLAEVGYGPDRVCMSDDTTCAFRIRVTK
jgi:hypothetical protein